MILTPDNFLNKKILFLAGTIDNGKSENWQEIVCEKLKDRYIIFNPRRNLSSEDFKNPEIGDYQINWEQKYINKSDIIFFHFLPNSLSPITLMELGFALGKKQQVIVSCPKEYWKFQNVKIMTQKYGGTFDEKFDTCIEYLWWNS